MSSVEVQVAAAEGCGGDFQDSVGGLLDLWVRAIFYGDLMLIVSTMLSPNEGQLLCLALKSLLSTTARIVSGGVKPMFVVELGCSEMRKFDWYSSQAFLPKKLVSSRV
jgi:hypothetical protein